MQSLPRVEARVSMSGSIPASAATVTVPILKGISPTMAAPAVKRSCAGYVGMGAHDSGNYSELFF